MTSPVIDGGNASTIFDGSGATAAVTGPVLAADLATYATRTPYLTAVEFTEAGTGVDVSQLVPAGTTGDQTAALTRVIGQASAWADAMVYKVLAATTDTQAGRYLPDASGALRVPVKFTPLLAVTAVTVGSAGYDAVPLADLSRVWIDGTVVRIDCPPGPGGGRDRRRFVTVTYVNGWTNTTVSAAVSAGATSLPLASTLGVHPGQVLTVDDGSTTEQVTVASSYVFGTAGPVPLATACTQAHSVGAAATALPPDIKRAVIALTAFLIKTRGNRAFVMGPNGIQSDLAKGQAGGNEDLEVAQDLLRPHRRAR